MDDLCWAQPLPQPLPHTPFFGPLDLDWVGLGFWPSKVHGKISQWSCPLHWDPFDAVSCCRPDRCRREKSERVSSGWVSTHQQQVLLDRSGIALRGVQRRPGLGCLVTASQQKLRGSLKQIFEEWDGLGEGVKFCKKQHQLLGPRGVPRACGNTWCP